jgi:hypothetical protein
MAKPKRIPEEVRDAIRGNTLEPELAEFVAHFFGLCGGAKGFAVLVHKEAMKAKEGSQTRQRYLDMVIRSLVKANERKGPGMGDSALLTDDDLAREAEAIMGRVHGEEEDTPESTQRQSAAPDAGGGADSLAAPGD